MAMTGNVSATNRNRRVKMSEISKVSMYPSGPCLTRIMDFPIQVTDAAKIISKMAVRLSAMNPLSRSLAFTDARPVPKSAWPKCAAMVPMKNRKLSLGQNR